MFEEARFATVNVEEIAAEAQISTRTFYRYFATKEDVLQVRIRREAESLREALEQRPVGEPPLHSLRYRRRAAISAEDPALHKRWIAVVAATPTALRAVLGGCILTLNGMLAEFFGSRLNVPADALVPTMLAAAAAGVIRAAEMRWVVVRRESRNDHFGEPQGPGGRRGHGSRYPGQGQSRGNNK